MHGVMKAVESRWERAPACALPKYSHDEDHSIGCKLELGHALESHRLQVAACPFQAFPLTPRHQPVW